MASEVMEKNSLPPKPYNLYKLHKKNIRLKHVILSLIRVQLCEYQPNTINNVIRDISYHIKNSWDKLCVRSRIPNSVSLDTFYAFFISFAFIFVRAILCLKANVATAWCALAG